MVWWKMMLSIVLFELDEFAWFVTDFFRPFHLNTEYFKKILIIDVFIQTISHLCYNNTLVILLALNCFSPCFCFFVTFIWTNHMHFNDALFSIARGVFNQIDILDFFVWISQFSEDVFWTKQIYTNSSARLTLLPPLLFIHWTVEINTFETKIKWIHIVS